jgi:hypothetical protein
VNARFLFFLLAAGAVSTGADAQTAQRDARISLAISDIRAAYNVKKDLAEGLSDIVVAEASKLKGYKIITQREIDTMLSYEQKKQMAGCTDTACVVALGGALGADKMLLGSISLFEKTFVVSLNLFDVGRAVVEQRVNVKIEGSDKKLMEEVERSVERLFGASSTVVDPTPAPAVRVAAPPIAEKGFFAGWRIPGTVSFGVAALGGTACVLVGKWANDARNEAQARPHERVEAEKLRDDYMDRATATNALIGVTAGGIVLGTVFFVLDMSESGPAPAEKKAAGLDLRPLLSPGWVGVSGFW